MEGQFLINKRVSANDNQSFLRGFMHLFDPAGLMNQKYRTMDVFSENNSFAKDSEMLSSDWINVGLDLQKSIEKIGNQCNG